VNLRHLAPLSFFALVAVLFLLPQTVGRQWAWDYLYAHPASVHAYSIAPGVLGLAALALGHAAVWSSPGSAWKRTLWIATAIVASTSCVLLFTMISRYGSDLTDAIPDLTPGVMAGMGADLAAALVLWFALALGPALVSATRFRVRPGAVYRIVGSESSDTERVRVIYRPSLLLGTDGVISVDHGPAQPIRPGECVGLALSPGWHTITIGTVGRPSYARLRAHVRTAPATQTVLVFSGSGRARLAARQEREAPFEVVAGRPSPYRQFRPLPWSAFRLRKPLEVDEQRQETWTERGLGPARPWRDSPFLTVPTAIAIGAAVGALALQLPQPALSEGLGALLVLLALAAVIGAALGIVREARRFAAFVPAREARLGWAAVAIGSAVSSGAFLVLGAEGPLWLPVLLALLPIGLCAAALLATPDMGEGAPSTIDRIRATLETESAVEDATRAVDWTSSELRGFVRLQFSTAVRGRGRIALEASHHSAALDFSEVLAIALSPGDHVLRVSVGSLDVAIPVPVRSGKRTAVYVGVIQVRQYLPVARPPTPVVQVMEPETGTVTVI